MSNPKIHLIYFRPNGKYYTSGEFELKPGECRRQMDGGVYLPDVVAKVRGWQRNGGQGALPGISGEWSGFILVKEPQSGLCHLLIPKMHILTEHNA